MAIPLLDYPLNSKQNQRVAGYEVPGDEQPRVHTTEDLLFPTDMDDLIEAAYRQIFFHAFDSDRESALESQLRIGQITVRDFIRGLLLSDTFKRSFYDLNSNYRFVEHCVQKALGRDVHNEREKISWSIVVATKGIKGFVDELLDTDEYLENFGFHTVPYQRRRILPQRTEGDRPFNIKSPRYDAYYRAKLGFPQAIWQVSVRSYRPDRKPRAGDPVEFMGMAQSIRPTGNPPQQLSAQNIDYERLVPYRKTT